MKGFGKQIVWGTAGVILCVLFCTVLEPPAKLEAAALSAGSGGQAAMRALGVVLLGICWWVGTVIADWQVSLLMQCLCILLGILNFAGAFHAYTSSTVWLFVGTFCLAAAVSKTGLIRRLALVLMRLFPLTFRGQVLALLLVGLICSPLIPSATAKVMLGGMLAYHIANVMGYEDESPGRYGLFLAALMGFAFLCPAFMTAGTNGYALLGVLPESECSDVTFLRWTQLMLPWLIVMTGGMYAAILRLYRPRTQKTLTRNFVRQELETLGRISKKEGEAAIILGVCLFFWILEKQFSVNSACVALLGALACFVLGILDSGDISKVIPWELILFLGGALNIGYLLQLHGIDLWIQQSLTPLFSSLSNRYLLVALMMVLVILLRFLLISLTATITLLMTILSPILLSVGIRPIVMGLVIYAAMLCWFVPYQNLVYLPGLRCMKGTISHGGTIKACVAYEVLTLVAFFLSIPLWERWGYL